MTTWPATFRREASSKAMGCLVYTVVAPFVAIFLWLFASIPLVFGLRALGGNPGHEKGLILGSLAVVAAGVVAWGVRDYRRRAAVEVVIDRDRVVVTSGGRREVCEFAEVDSIRLVGTGVRMGCILGRGGGGSLRLPPDVAPYSRVRELLEPTLIDRLRRELDGRLRAGEVVAVKERALGGLGPIVTGSGLLLGSLYVMFTLRPWLGMTMLRGGWTLLRQGWIGLGGGFELEARGVRGRSAGLIDWDELDQAEPGEVGLILRARDGRRVAASPYAENYWPARSWLATRRPPGAAGR